MSRSTTAVLIAAMLLATSASAQVKLVIKKDGSKLIVNDSRAIGGGRYSDYKWLARQHDRRSIYDGFIEQYSRQYGVDPVLVRAVIQVESNFNPKCVSNKGARGLMQLMPGTAKQYGVKQMHDPEDNIRGGIKYLAYLLEMFDDLPHVLAAYNAGEGAVQRYGGIPPYEETSTYVKRAMTVYYGRPYGVAGGAMGFAGGRGKASLRGGFGNAVVPPIASILLPGGKYLGTH
jgi:soluble lytic murein transglycosylase-like protein